MSWQHSTNAQQYIASIITAVSKTSIMYQSQSSSSSSSCYLLAGSQSSDVLSLTSDGLLHVWYLTLQLRTQLFRMKQLLHITETVTANERLPLHRHLNCLRKAKKTTLNINRYVTKGNINETATLNQILYEILHYTDTLTVWHSDRSCLASLNSEARRFFSSMVIRSFWSAAV